MKLLIASDHAGFPLKQHLKVKRPDLEWVDLGPDSEERVDYPDYADKVASEIHKNGGCGLLICGSGQGVNIRANRYPNVRSVLCWTPEVASLSRKHNDANILCLGARVMDFDSCEEILDAFLSTDFEGGRHIDRVNKLKGALK